MRAPFLLAVTVLALAGLLAWVAATSATLDGAAASGADVRSQSAAGDPPQPAPALDEPAFDATHEEFARGGRAAQRGAASTISGVVRHARTGELLEGFQVVARAGRNVLAEDNSDARGRFVLRDIEADAVQLQTTAPYGWMALEMPRRIERDERDAFADVEILARAAGFAPFRARLTDARTLEPVPFYSVRIGTAQGSREGAWSDRDGELVTEQEYPEGALLLFGYDIVAANTGANELKPTWYQEVQHTPRDGEAAVLELPIAVGPTYRIELDAPAAAQRDQLFATLWNSSPEFPSPVRPGAWKYTPLRWNDGCWVRFRPEMARYNWGATPVLAVSSLDGRWYGEGRVDGASGVAPAAVPITLTRRARLLGRAVDERGEGVSRATLSLFRSAPSGAAHAVGVTESAGNGLFDFSLAPAGVYRLRGVSMGHEVRETLVDVAEGLDVEFQLVLPRLPKLVEVSGVVTAPAELAPESVYVRLDSARERGRRLAQEVTLALDGDVLRGEFRFSDVPIAEYELVISAWGEVDVVAQPERLEFVAPRTNIAVRIERAPGEDCLQVRALDKKTGARIERAVLHVVAPGSTETRCLMLEGSRVCAPNARRADATWGVSAIGYQPAFGSISDLQFDGDTAEIVATLEPGWGLDLEVLGPGYAPLSGVEVFAGDELLAATDARGKARLRRDAAPAALSLRHADWRIGLDSDQELANALTSQLPPSSLRVWMSPP